MRQSRSRRRSGISSCGKRREIRERRFRATASLGLRWLPAGTLSGYAVVFVPFENGKPSGPARDILTGFLASGSPCSLDGESFFRLTLAAGA
jgi:hypothetical protein